MLLRCPVLICLGGIALAQTLPPKFVIDPGTHSRPITAISVDRNETFMVTGSLDRTVRMWDLRDHGKLIQTIHLAIASDNPDDTEEGEVYAVALSPDDRTIAYGGHTGHFGKHLTSFFIYDRPTNSIAQVGNFKSDIRSLHFSAGGNYLIYMSDGRFAGEERLGGSGGVAIRVGNADGSSHFEYSPSFTVGSGVLAADVARFEDGDALVMLWKDPATKRNYVRIDRIGPNGLVRLKDADAPLRCARPEDLRITPDSRYMVFGCAGADDDHPTTFYVQPLSGGDPYALDNKGAIPIGAPTPLLDSSGFAAPAKLLGKDKNGEETYTAEILTWRVAPRNASVSVKALKNLEDDPTDGLLTPLKNGRAVWSSAWGDWTLYNGNKEEAESTFDSVFLDHHDNVGVSRDGSEVFFQDTDPNDDAAHRHPMLFSLNQRSLVASTAPGTSYRFFETGDANVPGLDSENKLLNGQPLAGFDEDEEIVATEFTATAIYLGGENEVHVFSRKGARLWQTKGLGSAIEQIRATPGGRLLFVILEDGTFRWISTANGQLKLSAFLAGDRQRWIAWTPEGYYDASPGGEFLGGYVATRIGVASVGDFYPLSSAGKGYHRPDVVHAVFSQAAVAPPQESTTVSRGGPGLGPVVTIQASQPFNASSTTLRFGYKVEPSDAKISFRIDGRPIPESRGAKPAGPQAEIAIEPRDCVVSVIAEDSAGRLGSAELKVHWTGPVAAQQALPVLHILSIGISNYTQPGWVKLMAAKDAQDLAATFKAQEGKFYSRVEVMPVLNEDATAERIRDELDKLRSANRNDTVIIFIAGHGAEDDDRSYYFLSSDFKTIPGSSAVKFSSALDFDEIIKRVAKIPSKTVLFIDTCHSGGSIDARSVAVAGINWVASKAFDPNGGGAVVFTASQGNQNAQESRAFGAGGGNGAFTAAIIEGLRGEAVNRTGEISIASLDDWLGTRVQQLTCNQQKPSCAKRDNFSIATKISDEKAKPFNCPTK